MTITVTAVGQTDGEVLFVDTEEGVWKDPTTAIPAATNSTPGLMAAAEHVKLAEIEAGATVAGATGDAFAISHPGGNQHIDWTSDQGATNIHSSNLPDLSGTYAVAAKGVTNGDSHDHSGGDGAQISYSSLSNIPATPKLDDLASADDNTDLNATTSAHGLLLKATAPAAGLINVVGIANGETAYTNKALFDTVNPEILGTESPGTAVVAARRDHVHAAWDGDITDINLDGGTDIGAALADADLILVDDGAGGTNRKAALSRVKTYAQGIALDTFAAPTDGTTLNASTSAHGLLPKLSNTATEYLNGTGAWSIPAGGVGVLSADRTYYVRTDGNNNNDGLTDSAGGAFLTIQKAVDAASLINANGYAVTVQIKDGTYTGAVVISRAPLSATSFTIQGNAGTPTNVVGSSIQVIGAIAVIVKNMKLVNPASNICIYALLSAYLTISGIDFGAANSSHIRSALNATIILNGNYTISGASSSHLVVLDGGTIVSAAITVTISGTPAFSSAFAFADIAGMLEVGAITYSGSATGKRYSITLNSVCQTYGGGANYFPGNSAGTTATGGQYA